MKLYEIAIEYHDELNPKLWDGFELNDEVSDKLNMIADEFEKFLDVDGLEISDVIITGSNANYNWTAQSDIDLHLIVDLSDIESRCPEFTDDFFMDKKTLWNEHHDITIHNHPVEVYVQDEAEPHIASGVYSLKNDEWIKKPTHSPPSYDSEDVRIKSDQLKKEIDRLINTTGDREDVQNLKDKIRRYRQAGLSTSGEFSTENFTFKELRNSGYLKKLSDYGRKAKSDELSLK